MALLPLTLLLGCESDSPTMQQRQDQALRDPFSYGPTIDSLNDDRKSEPWQFDRKGMERDLNSIFNP
jgi:hypothetical protein